MPDNGQNMRPPKRMWAGDQKHILQALLIWHDLVSQPVLLLESDEFLSPETFSHRALQISWLYVRSFLYKSLAIKDQIVSATCNVTSACRWSDFRVVCRATVHVYSSLKFCMCTCTVYIHVHVYLWRE